MKKYSVVCIEYYTIFCLSAILSLNITTTSHYTDADGLTYKNGLYLPH